MLNTNPPGKLALALVRVGSVGLCSDLPDGRWSAANFPSWEDRKLQVSDSNRFPRFRSRCRAGSMGMAYLLE